MKTKSTAGVGVLVGSGVAVGGRGVGVRVGGAGVGVWVGCDVAVGGTGVAVGGSGVGGSGVAVGGSGVGVAVSIGVGVLVDLGRRVGEGVGVGAATDPHPTSKAPDNRMPTATITMRFNAPVERWDPSKDEPSLTRITFPLRAGWDIIPADRRIRPGAGGRIRTDMRVPSLAFEASASAVPPLRPVCDIMLVV